MTDMNNPWESRRFPQEANDPLIVFPVIAYRGMVPLVGQQRESTNPHFTWWWFENGAAEVTTRNERIMVEAGEWVLIPVGLWRRQSFQPSSEIISINFVASWRNNFPLVRMAAPLVGKEETVPGLIDAAKRVTSALKPLEDEPPLTIRSLPLSRRFQLIGALYEFSNTLLSHAVSLGAEITATQARDARIDWVVRDLHHTLRAGPLPFSRWQERSGLSRSQLERLAQKHLGRSLLAYRDELLTSATCRALASEGQLVKQVAEEFGFVDTAHFCRWLKMQTGHTPATIQKTAVV